MPDTPLYPAVEFMVENAVLIFKNFEGRATTYNREGDRNFSLVLTDAMAEALTADGWNVRTLAPREEGDDPQFILDVAVEYKKGKPPKIYLITNGGKTRTHLDKDTVGALDSLDIEKWDLMINPYIWSVQDKKGVKAYLKTAYVTVREDELDRKYGALPEA